MTSSQKRLMFKRKVKLIIKIGYDNIYLTLYIPPHFEERVWVFIDVLYEARMIYFYDSIFVSNKDMYTSRNEMLEYIESILTFLNTRHEMSYIYIYI